MVLAAKESALSEVSDSHGLNNSNSLSAGESGETSHELLGIGKKQDRVLLGIRSLTFLVLVLVGVAVSISVYFVLRHVQVTSFDNDFRAKANRILASVTERAALRSTALESFAQEMISSAKVANQTWPAVTVPDFEKRGRYLLRIASLISAMLLPVVQEEDREAWERHSRENFRWLEDSMTYQERLRDPMWEKPANYSQSIYTLGDMALPYIATFTEYDESPGPYTPIWQTVPAQPHPFQAINFNLLLIPQYSFLNTTLQTGKVTIAKAFVPFENEEDLGRQTKTKSIARYMEDLGKYGGEYKFDPISDLAFPIRLLNENGELHVVAVLKCFIYWRTYFVDILPEGQGPLLVILGSSCGDEYSYEVEGTVVSYLGEGDYHEFEFDRTFEKADFSGLQGEDEGDFEESENVCKYTVKVYPTLEMKARYVTKEPAQLAIVATFVFLFTLALFILYDFCLHRRKAHLESRAIKSTKIVSSLFPKTVRERVFEEGADGPRKSTQKVRLRNLLLTKDQKRNDGTLEDSDPIADHFEACTVFFADLAGFTYWCNNRRPDDVFRFLETVYGAFDKLTHKYKVFKVETIGDCYLAVAGLPEPQEMHASTMTHFALACMDTFAKVLQEGESIFGSDAMKLKFRCGLHSGPVTAGVLRGERSRFQLFGDTVNMASRMESTGLPDHIQISEATFDELHVTRQHTSLKLEVREDAVEVKGKGSLKTYFVKKLPQSASPTSI